MAAVCDTCANGTGIAYIDPTSLFTKENVTAAIYDDESRFKEVYQECEDIPGDDLDEQI